MDLEKDFHRINQIIDEMSIEDFEKMLFDCGLGVIKLSEQIFSDLSTKKEE